VNEATRNYVACVIDAIVWRENAQVMGYYGIIRHLSDNVVDYVKRTGKNPLEAGKRKVTVLFFDICHQ
jgi:hypothetical protein